MLDTTKCVPIIKGKIKKYRTTLLGIGLSATEEYSKFILLLHR